MQSEEAQSNCFPPKKPAERVGFRQDQIFVRARLNTLLKQLHELDQKREVVHDSVRKLTRVLRKDDGRTPWIPIAFAFGICGAMVLVIIKLQPKTFIYQAPKTYWRVMTRYSDGKQFMMQQVEQGKPLEPVVMNSCDELPWEGGITLRRFEYDYADGCFKTGTQNPERWYSLVRDSHGCPIVPDNCHHTSPTCDPETDHILCNGEPKFD